MSESESNYKQEIRLVPVCWLTKQRGQQGISKSKSSHIRLELGQLPPTLLIIVAGGLSESTYRPLGGGGRGRERERERRGVY